MRLKVDKETVKKLEKELKNAQKLNNLKLFKIIKSLLSIAEGTSIEDISRVLGVCERTIFNWLSRFMWERFSWLLWMSYKGRGRKPKLNKEQRGRLYKIVEHGPETYGFDCGIWNSAMILEVIQKEFNVSYNPRYLCDLLKKMGLSYQKAKFVSDRLDDEEHLKKRKEWDEEKWPEILDKAKKMKGLIFFEDEVSFAQWGSLSYTWGPKGKQPLVKTCGKRKGLKMFGAIEVINGDFEYMECDGKFNGESYIEFLKQLLDKYSCPIFLIEDGAPYHRSGLVKEFKNKMEKQKRLFVYRLPSYSPDKNPIEKLWRNTKKNATHLKYFKSFEDLRSSVINTFNKYLSDASKVICVMKKLRCEAGFA